jgi:soluble lytic murein transglycosylase-like protein
VIHMNDVYRGLRRLAALEPRVGIATVIVVGGAFGVTVGLGHGLGQFAVSGQRAAVAIAAEASATRTRGLPADTLDDRSTAARYVSSWRTDLRRTPNRLLDAYLARPDPWRDELLPILEAHSVPPEFLYLALLESGMDPSAESPAEAVGLWQFTEPTARQYGLIIGDDIDERLDWRRSTYAAGRYLRDLYDLFGTWELAAAAYNSGPGRVSKALETSGADSYWQLIAAGHLPRETRNYVPRFLAIVELAGERVGQ